MIHMKITLTKAEEDIMQRIWEKERCTISDLLDEMGEPRPPHSSVSTIVRILEKKGFVGHKTYGRTYEYFPTVSKDAYSKSRLDKLAGDYFSGSYREMVSFMVEEERLDPKELEEFINNLKSIRQ